MTGRRRIVSPAANPGSPLDTLSRRAWDNEQRVGLTCASDGPYEIIVSTARQPNGHRAVIDCQRVHHRNVELAAAELLHRLRHPGRTS